MTVGDLSGRLAVPGRPQRRALIRQIINNTRRLADIPQAETRAAQWVGPAGNSDMDGTKPSGTTSGPPAHPDPARQLDHIDRIDTHLRAAARELDAAVSTIDLLLHQPTVADFKADVTTAWPPDACRWHRDILNTYTPAHTTHPTTLGGILPTPELICEACYDRTRRIGRRPTRDDLTHFHTTGKWKKIHTNPKGHR